MDELIGVIQTVPFFTDKNVIIIRDCELFREKHGSGTKESDDDEASDENAATQASEGGKKRGAKKKYYPEAELIKVFENMPEFSYVIFESNHKADKRRKLTKALLKHGNSLEAEAIKAWNIEEWLQGKLQELHISMDTEALQYFIGAVGMMSNISLGYLDQEMNKLALYTDKKRIDRKLLVEVFSNIPEVSGFAMTDAISQHNTRKALFLLDRQLHDGVAVPVIVGLLVYHVRQLWQAKRLRGKGIRGRAMASAMSLNPYIADKVGQASDTFTNQQLKEAFLALADMDYTSKSGQSETVELDSIVIRLCQRSG